jgi:hypothetical protein
MELRCSSGAIEAKVGDHFTDSNGEWEIVSFKENELTYSPDVLGGTPTVVVKPVGRNLDPWFQKYANADSSIDFCGDSVAAAMLTKSDGRKRDARGYPLKT